MEASNPKTSIRSVYISSDHLEDRKEIFIKNKYFISIIVNY